MPLVLYAVSGTVSTYFVWHAVHGERGLRTKDEYRARMTELSATLGALSAERAAWQRRVDMLRTTAVDKDLLEEEARVVLDRVHKNDLVVYLPLTSALPVTPAVIPNLSGPNLSGPNLSNSNAAPQRVPSQTVSVPPGPARKLPVR